MFRTQKSVTWVQTGVLPGPCRVVYELLECHTVPLSGSWGFPRGLNGYLAHRTKYLVHNRQTIISLSRLDLILIFHMKDLYINACIKFWDILTNRSYNGHTDVHVHVGLRKVRYRVQPEPGRCRRGLIVRWVTLSGNGVIGSAPFMHVSGLNQAEYIIAAISTWPDWVRVWTATTRREQSSYTNH